MTIQFSGFTPTLPSDVFQMIGFCHDFVINHQKNQPPHQEGEVFDLSEKFVTDMENLLRLAKQYNLDIYEDSAQALGAKLKNRFA